MSSEIPDAKTMRIMTINRQEIKDHIDSILNVINEELRLQENTTKTSIIHYLKTTFSIPGLKEAEAQNLIYSSVIRELAGKGYKCEINPYANSGKRTPLMISWSDSQDQDQHKHNASLLAKYTNKNLK